MDGQRKPIVWIVWTAFLVLGALACNLPSARRATPTTAPTAITEQPAATAAPTTAAPTPSSAPPAPIETDAPAAAPPPSDACPAPAEVALPAAKPPFDRMGTAINTYLSAGGSIDGLQAGLESWEAIGTYGGTLAADTDLTGDATPEVLVIVLDAENAFATGAPGTVLIYGCAGGAYRLLYDGAMATDSEVDTPRLIALKDINANGLTDVIYTMSYCGAHTCGVSLYPVEYQPASGSFTSLLAEPVLGVPYGEVTLTDTDGNGVTEIVVDVGAVASVGAGPQRTMRDTFMWDGTAYTLGESIFTTPRLEWYPIHYIQDGDRAAEQGQYELALASYRAVTDAEAPLTWALGEAEIPALQLYARYRMMVTYLLTGQPGNATTAANYLIRYAGPADDPAAGFAAIGQTFWTAYQDLGSVGAACDAAVAYATANPASYDLLNQFGYANRLYEPPDLCPFEG